MRTFFRYTFLLPLLAISLTGCKGKSRGDISKEGYQEITINITAEPQTLDPQKVRSLGDINLIRMFMDGLTRIDKEGNSSLAIAEKVTISRDKKIYTFTLKDSKWSNGDNVTSKDFSYAWKKSLRPDFNAPNATMLYPIKNAKEAKLGTLPLSLVGIETPDDKTLVVTLNHPTPYFLELLANPIYFPVNQSVDRGNSHWAEKEITYVGNGPFVLGDWKHHNIIVAKKNDRYWDKQVVHLSHINMVMVTEETGFKMFNTRELNWSGSPFSNLPVDALEHLKREENLNCVPFLGTQLIRVNTDHSPFESKKMRRAFAYAIDRDAIVKHIVQGNQIPATGIVPTAMGLQEDPYFNDGDAELAKELFNEALSDQEITTEKLPEIVLIYVSRERNHLVAQALQSQWRKAFGIHVKLEPVEFKVFFDRVAKKDYTLSLSNWIADFNDPINFLEVFKTKDAGTNNTNWENPSYCELLETALYCTNTEERNTILQRSEELLMKEMPVIPIFHYTMLYVQDDKLKDVVLTPMGRIDFKWAQVKGK